MGRDCPLYDVLDWHNPTAAMILVVIIMFCCVPLCQYPLWWCVYKRRVADVYLTQAAGLRASHVADVEMAQAASIGADQVIQVADVELGQVADVETAQDINR